MSLNKEEHLEIEKILKAQVYTADKFLKGQHEIQDVMVKAIQDQMLSVEKNMAQVMIHQHKFKEMMDERLSVIAQSTFWSTLKRTFRFSKNGSN